MRTTLTLLGLAIVVLMSGCSRVIPELESFGAVKGIDATRSVNGLGVHRKMWESAGAKCLFPQKLSPKLETFDTILLVGQSFAPPGSSARKWLEEWLSREEGRSVVYFGRDFNANLYYREKTLGLLDESQRDKGQVDLARAQTEELSLRVEQIQESTFCGWFYLDVATARRTFSAEELKSTWSKSLGGLEGDWPLGMTLREPTAKWRSQTPTWITNPPQNGGLMPASSIGPQSDDDGVLKRSVWQPSEYADQKQWNQAFRNLPDTEVLLSSSDDRPMIFRLTDDDWPESQILVVANGAPFLNASLVDGLHRRVAEKIIEECLPARRVALLAFGTNGLYISDIAEEDIQAAGLEMFTVWPLSGITMPLALLGVIVCAALLPILGRARELPRRSVSDFGLHVDALGRMLQDSRDTRYAKKVISDYFHRVRGEAPPPWLDQIATQETNHRPAVSPATVNAPTVNSPTSDASQSDVPTSSMLTNDLPTNDLPTSDLPTEDTTDKRLDGQDSASSAGTGDPMPHPPKLPQTQLEPEQPQLEHGQLQAQPRKADHPPSESGN